MGRNKMNKFTAAASVDMEPQGKNCLEVEGCIERYDVDGIDLQAFRH